MVSLSLKGIFQWKKLQSYDVIPRHFPTIPRQFRSIPPLATLFLFYLRLRYIRYIVSTTKNSTSNKTEPPLCSRGGLPRCSATLKDFDTWHAQIKTTDEEIHRKTILDGGKENFPPFVRLGLFFTLPLQSRGIISKRTSW